MNDIVMLTTLAGMFLLSVLFFVTGVGACVVVLKKSWSEPLNTKRIALLMRVLSVLSALAGMWVCALLVPLFAAGEGGFEPWFWPWEIFASIFALPCFGVVACVWAASGHVRRDAVFSLPMARVVGTGAVLTAGDGVFLLAGNLVMYALGLSSPQTGVILMLSSFMMISLAALAGALSHYVEKAAVLQSDSDGLL